MIASGRLGMIRTGTGSPPNRVDGVEPERGERGIDCAFEHRHQVRLPLIGKLGIIHSMNALYRTCRWVNGSTFAATNGYDTGQARSAVNADDGVKTPMQDLFDLRLQVGVSVGNQPTFSAPFVPISGAVTASGFTRVGV